MVVSRPSSDFYVFRFPIVQVHTFFFRFPEMTRLTPLQKRKEKNDQEKGLLRILLI